MLQGFVVVYSLTNHQTFQDIKTMRDQIVRVKGTDRVPILLVGNKVGFWSRKVGNHGLFNKLVPKVLY